MNWNPSAVLFQGFTETLNNLWLYPIDGVWLKHFHETAAVSYTREKRMLAHENHLGRRRDERAQGKYWRKDVTGCKKQRINSEFGMYFLTCRLKKKTTKKVWVALGDLMTIPHPDVTPFISQYYMYHGITHFGETKTAEKTKKMFFKL